MGNNYIPPFKRYKLKQYALVKLHNILQEMRLVLYQKKLEVLQREQAKMR